MEEDKIIQNIKRCPRFDSCSANICPLDLEANQRTYVKGENVCPFTIKKKQKSQRGIRTLLPDSLFKFIPKSNLKMLNKRNLNRWCQKKYNRIEDFKPVELKFEPKYANRGLCKIDKS